MLDRRYRVLVVDDYRDIAEGMCRLLEILGQDGHMATTGQGALEEASRFEPEIAIIDLALPDISGLDVARMLRSQASGRRLYLAALTAGGTQARIRDDALAAGFDQYLIKPANLRELLRAAAERLSEQ
jgi:DNA-binding response OmpR family regulator